MPDAPDAILMKIIEIVAGVANVFVLLYITEYKRIKQTCLSIYILLHMCLSKYFPHNNDKP